MLAIKYCTNIYDTLNPGNIYFTPQLAQILGNFFEIIAGNSLNKGGKFKIKNLKTNVQGELILQEAKSVEIIAGKDSNFWNTIKLKPSSSNLQDGRIVYTSNYHSISLIDMMDANDRAYQLKRLAHSVILGFN